MAEGRSAMTNLRKKGRRWLKRAIARLEAEPSDASEPVQMDGFLSRDIGLARYAFPDVWNSRVQTLPITRGRPKKGFALRDFGGQVGLHVSVEHPPPKRAEPDRLAKAIRNAEGLARILREARARDPSGPEVRAALDAIDAGMLAYFKRDGDNALRQRAAHITMLLELLHGRAHGAVIAYRDCRFDRGGLARIPISAWKKAFKRWDGIHRSARPGARGKNAYDWRDVVLDLLDVAAPSGRKRIEARRWLDGIAGSRVKPKS